MRNVFFDSFFFSETVDIRAGTWYNFDKEKKRKAKRSKEKGPKHGKNGAFG